MQVEYKLTIGQDEFRITGNVETEIEFFEKMSFYAGLPKTGPNGETDLKLTFRSTKEGYKYYSLVSEQAGQEFKFGQVKDAGGELFPKGWEALYRGSADASSNVTSINQSGGVTAAQATTSEARVTQRSASSNATVAPRAAAASSRSPGDIITQYGPANGGQQTAQARNPLLRK